MEPGAVEGVREPLATSELGKFDQAREVADRHHDDGDHGDHDDGTYDPRADFDDSGAYVRVELRNDHDVLPAARDYADGSVNDDHDPAANDHHDNSGAHAQHGIPDGYA